MVIGADALIPRETWRIMRLNEIMFGQMSVTWGQTFILEIISGYSYDFRYTSRVSLLRYDVDWLVYKICPGEVYCHSISNITVFRLV